MPKSANPSSPGWMSAIGVAVPTAHRLLHRVSQSWAVAQVASRRNLHTGALAYQIADALRGLIHQVTLAHDAIQAEIRNNRRPSRHSTPVGKPAMPSRTETTVQS